MNYCATDLDALIEAADTANAEVPFNAHSAQFVTAAQALLPHVYRAIAALGEHVPHHSNDEVKAHIAALRDLGHTLAEIASAAGVSVATISRITNDVRSSCHPMTAAAIMDLELLAPPSPVDPEVVEALLDGANPPIRVKHRPAYLAHLAGLEGMTEAVLARTMRVSRIQAATALRKARS